MTDFRIRTVSLYAVVSKMKIGSLVSKTHNNLFKLLTKGRYKVFVRKQCSLLCNMCERPCPDKQHVRYDARAKNTRSPALKLNVTSTAARGYNYRLCTFIKYYNDRYYGKIENNYDGG